MKCFVDGCVEDQIRPSPDVTFHRFPKNAEVAAIWANVCQPRTRPWTNREVENMHKGRRYVCSRHFSSSSFHNNKLISGTIPLKRLPGLRYKSYPARRTFVGPKPSLLITGPQSMSSTGSNLDHSQQCIEECTFLDPISSVPLDSCVEYFRSIDRAHARPHVQTVQITAEAEVDPDKENRPPEGVPTEVIDQRNNNDYSDMDGSLQTTVSTPYKYLKDIGASSVDDLTPRKKFLYNEAQRWRGKFRVARRRLKVTQDERKALLQKVRTPGNWEFLRGLNAEAADFIQAQIENKSKKPKGIRWREQTKVLALALWKRSPKNYKLLRTIFKLPAESTLQHLLSKLPMEPGIHENTLKLISQEVGLKENGFHLCAALFDEMSIKEHLEYSVASDKIVGFVSYGGGSKMEVANYVLVFMLRGLKRKYKQPIAYFPSRGGLNSRELTSIIKDVLKACDEAGLLVLTTVCDLGSSQVSALKRLGATFDEPSFKWNGRKIFTIYDPPHLLKCVRNLLLMYRLDCELVMKANKKAVRGIADWQHIRDLYEEEKKNMIMSALHKLTDDHVYPQGKVKMRVSVAAQVFSQTVSVALGMMSRFNGGKTLAMASLCGEMNDLLDSFNGRTKFPEGGKPLKCRLEEGSPHLEFWREERKRMATWKYLGRKKEAPPPSQRAWPATLIATQELWHCLKREHNMEYLQTYVLNQDALENSFGTTRGNCGNTDRPTLPMFTGAFTTGLICGSVYEKVDKSTKNANKRNCEDDGDSLLSNLTNMMAIAESSAKTIEEIEEEKLTDCANFFLCEAEEVEELVMEASKDRVLSFLERQAVAYVTGYALKRIFRKNSACNSCKEALSMEVMQPDHELIHSRERTNDRRRLVYPSKWAAYTMKTAARYQLALLNKYGNENFIQDKSLFFLRENVDMSWLNRQNTGCPLHFKAVREQFLTSVFRITVKRWCILKNRTIRLAAKEKRIANRRKLRHFQHV